MELIKLNLEIPYEKAGAEKPESAAQLVCYLQQPQNMPVPRPAVVICPGGGYRYTSSRESESIAMQYLAAGMQAFVLYYNCAPAVFPCALLELAKSVSIVRSHAAEWNIDPEKILVAGFSAGGHLAASLGCFWNQSFVYEPLGLLAEDIRPNGNIQSSHQASSPTEAPSTSCAEDLIRKNILSSPHWKNRQAHKIRQPSSGTQTKTRQYQ